MKKIACSGVVILHATTRIIPIALCIFDAGIHSCSFFHHRVT